MLSLVRMDFGLRNIPQNADLPSRGTRGPPDAVSSELIAHVAAFSRDLEELVIWGTRQTHWACGGSQILTPTFSGSQHAHDILGTRVRSREPS